MTVRNDTFPVLRPNFQVIREHARKYQGLDMEAIETALEFVRVASEFFSQAEAFFARFGLSRTRFTVLVTLAQTPEGLSPAQIADSLRVTRATVTGLIDTLEKGGHVERRDDPSDRRRFTIVITPAGMAFLDKVLPANFRRMKILLASLSSRERADFRRLLQKFESGIDVLGAEPSAPARRRA